MVRRLNPADHPITNGSLGFILSINSAVLIRLIQDHSGAFTHPVFNAICNSLYILSGNFSLATVKCLDIHCKVCGGPAGTPLIRDLGDLGAQPRRPVPRHFALAPLLTIVSIVSFFRLR